MPFHLLSRRGMLTRIHEQLTALEAKMSAQLDALAAQVKANDDLLDSALTLIKGLADQLVAIKDDPAKIQALADELKAKDDALASAISANTPAAP